MISKSQRWTSYRIVPSLLLLLCLMAAGAVEVQAQGTITSQWQDLALGGGKLIVSVNVNLVRWNEAQIQIDSQDRVGSFTLRTPGWTIAGITTDVEGHRFLVLQRQEASTGIANITVEGPAGRGRLGIISIFLNGAQQIKVTSQPTFLPIEITPPGGGSISPLKRYDQNRDNLINDAEFFAIIDGWVANEISNEIFFRAIDLWLSQSSISGAGLRLEPVTLTTLATDRDVIFLAHGSGVSAMSVEVFDLSGQRIFSQQALGSRLAWSIGGLGGQQRANGLYVVRVAITGEEGRTVFSKMEKFLIRR